MSKKVLCVFCCLSLLLTGCGSNNETSTTGSLATTEQVTEAKSTTIVTEAPTTESSELILRENLNGLSDNDAKAKDLETAGKLATIINATLTDEQAFEDVYDMAGVDGISIKPDGDGLFTYYYPQGKNIDHFIAAMDKLVEGESFEFNYKAALWQPDEWFFMTDKDFNVYLYVITTDNRVFQVYPNIDPHYNYGTRKNHEKEMKENDVVTAAKIKTAFMYALANEEGYVEFDTMIGQQGFAIKPYGDGSYDYIFPEGTDPKKLAALMDEKLHGLNIAFNYCPSDWDPYLWYIGVDNRYNPYVAVQPYEGDYVELDPQIDPLYKFD